VLESVITLRRKKLVIGRQGLVSASHNGHLPETNTIGKMKSAVQYNFGARKD
jgi:hypothetical protein